MECIIGIQGPDYVLIAADTIAARSILQQKHDVNKIFKLGSRLALATTGEPGDADQFSEYIQRNVELYKMRNGYEMDTHSAVHFTRRTIAECLRSRSPYFVNVLVGGLQEDENKQTFASLYFLDYLGTMHRVPFACHGYASYLILSVLDRNYHASLRRDEAVEILRKSIAEAQHRLTISLPKFNAIIIDRDGVHQQPL